MTMTDESRHRPAPWPAPPEPKPGIKHDDGKLRWTLLPCESRGDERRADAIYAAVFAAAYPHVSAWVAMSHAEDAVEAWRAAQKGGSDG